MAVPTAGRTQTPSDDTGVGEPSPAFRAGVGWISRSPVVTGLIGLYWACAAGFVGFAYHAGYAKFAHEAVRWAPDKRLLLQVARDQALADAAVACGACVFVFTLAVAVQQIAGGGKHRGSNPS
jgi:hypothetical protein